MIKNIIQYIKDVEYTMRGSIMDDFIWIYIPLLVLAVGSFALFAAWSALVIKVLS
jgi:hypothetical protein